MGRANVEKSIIFMYGEFMNSNHIKFRCPDALCSGMAILDGFRFMINSRGVATLVPDAASSVQGVLWRVTPYDEHDIDITVGYNAENAEKSRCSKVILPVRTSVGMPVEAIVYMDKDITPGEPNPGYMQKVISGAAEHAVEKKYIDEVLRQYKQKIKREMFTTY